MVKNKKEILLESMVIDNSNEFTPLEKKILKKFFKTYGLENDFNVYENAAMLIEELEMDYQSAFDLSHTFLTKRDILFSESSYLRTNFEKNKIFFKYLNTQTEQFAKYIEDGASLPEKTIPIKIKGDEEITERVIRFWDSYGGFMFYLPLSYDHSKSIIVYASFNKKEDPNRKYYDDDNNFEVNINYSIGDGDRTQKSFYTFDYPYPEKITTDSIYETISKIYDIVKDKVSNYEFSM
jgi:hypothetical protein